MTEQARLESFGEASARCREDFEALLHDRLDDLEPALTWLGVLVADVELLVTPLAQVRCRRVINMVTSLVTATSLLSNRARFAVAALSCARKRPESPLLRQGGLTIPAPVRVLWAQDQHRLYAGQNPLSYQAHWADAQAPSPTVVQRPCRVASLSRP